MMTGELEQRIIADLEESLMVPEGSPAPRCTMSAAVIALSCCAIVPWLYSYPPTFAIVS